jgi:hypothetical protein
VEVRRGLGFKDGEQVGAEAGVGVGQRVDLKPQLVQNAAGEYVVFLK